MRLRRLLIAILSALTVALLGGIATAGSKTESGKDLYKQNCRVCHEKDSANGEYSPMSLIQDQWQSFFKDKLASTHKAVDMPGTSKKLMQTLTPEQIKTIEKFCIDHAADSEQPQTCS